MNKTRIVIATAVAATAVLVGCASRMGGAAADADQVAADMVKAGFRSQGIATVDRVTGIDETLKLCNAADVAGKPLAAEVAKRIEAENLKTVKWPSDGKFLGDWKEGEKIAQSGRGQTWTDAANTVNGGNCYNCHQIAKEEISFGTIGPSLYHYGKLRGVTDPASAAAKPIVEYTWGKIWNAKAYNACSNMPRSGHMGNLTEGQVRDIMALLLDPASPVNK
ncbi:sulfur oxidation c-type cytochrome SoxX [Pseudorhodoferax sp. Leaf265]|uniref:sulfur oxidation c-type cytochrome SoxX n=1 Tax=Pseudorhodoferax sp. Leaf265 TaxID=1736315 RepID=UPI0006F61AE5|nr:sulfur oxidation c-type cytochrome SoxX [Pseudorhodoferax sp. Leaf265]KQP15950.1 sulfur oxidation c-type cytochrome SoxX [Pseudorhodoferax sp. Leaf265]